MSEYINQREIDAVAEELRSISPELRIEGISARNGKAFAVDLTIMEKGNKPLIDKLLAIGFQRAHRRKFDDGRIFGTQYDGYAFRLTLRKFFGEDDNND